MKKVKYTLLIALAIISIKLSGDVIIIDYQPAKVCVKIGNISDYPDIKIVAVHEPLTGFSKPVVEIVDSKKCTEIRKACSLVFYAVKKDYLKKKGIKKIDWKKDKNVRKSYLTFNAKDWKSWYDNVEMMEINFYIMGFKDNEMIIYQSTRKNILKDGGEIIDESLFTKEDIDRMLKDSIFQKSF